VSVFTGRVTIKAQQAVMTLQLRCKWVTSVSIILFSGNEGRRMESEQQNHRAHNRVIIEALFPYCGLNTGQ
jgi:hypothetical protein